MKIGIIGRGMVGSAIYDVLFELGYNISFFDPKYKNSKIKDILNTDIVFVSVPTIPDVNNKCDLSILLSVLNDLEKIQYKGFICIKSTVVPGSTQDFIKKFKNDKICFCPEFLRERCAYEDFKNNNKICIIGTNNLNAFNLIKQIHLPICDTFKLVTPTEAELTKYMQNVYNTYRILFANGFYEVCNHNNVNYSSVLDSLLVRGEIDEKYLKCNENIRGPSGPCLVKDTLAFNEYVKDLNLELNINIFEAMVNDMKLYPKTVMTGTRTEKEYFGEEINK